MIENIKIIPKCSCLINQNKFIGKDPIGHTCYNDAVFSDGVFFFCQECRDKIISGDMEGISLPNFSTVELYNSRRKNWKKEQNTIKEN